MKFSASAIYLPLCARTFTFPRVEPVTIDTRNRLFYYGALKRGEGRRSAAIKVQERRAQWREAESPALLLYRISLTTGSQIQPTKAQLTAWAPLRRRQYRALWAAQTVSNFGTWMQNVGAAWLMTTLSASPLTVSLVQSATSLPIFLFALPAGAVADLVDRRRLLIFTQSWMTIAAAVLGILTLAGATTPAVLLGLTFALGLGSAMNGPGWQAIVSELVPHEEMTSAVALNSISFNVARAAGPALGGLVVAAAGSGFTFVLNAASFLGVIVVLYLWRRMREQNMLPVERMVGAIKTGVRYIRHSPPVTAVLVREGAFVFCASGLWALLPVVASQTLKTHAVGYGVLLGFIGGGAVSAAAFLPAIRRILSANRLTAIGPFFFAIGTLSLAYVRVYALLCIAMFIAGIAWTCVMSTFNVTAQMGVPSWVRARVLAMYLLTFQGGLAGGSAAWGTLATHFGLPVALMGATVGLGAGVALLVSRYPLAETMAQDIQPGMVWPEPSLARQPEPDEGPVLITVEYEVPAENAARFVEAMREVSRIRKRDGASQWALFRDAAEPLRYVETFIVDSWADYLRQQARTTVSDQRAEEHARSFSVSPPRVSHFLHAYRSAARVNDNRA